MSRPVAIDDLARRAALRAALKSEFGPRLGQFALEYLLWPARMARVESSHPSQNSSPTSSAEGLVFRDHLLGRYPSLAEEDTRAAIEMLFAVCHRLTDWMDIIRLAAGIDLEFDNDEPRLAIENAQDWLKLTDWFDPDAVVCFLLAQRDRWDPSEKLLNWGVTTRIGAHDLDVHLKGGLSDLHVHLGGIRSGQVLWRNLFTGRVPLERVPAFATTALLKMARADPARYRESVAIRDRIRAVCAERADPFTPLGSLWDSVQCRPGDAAKPDRNRLNEARDRERGMLASAWRVLRDWRTGQPPPRDAPQIEHWLDRYLFAKNGFLRWHKQPSQTNPGLNAFRRFFHATAPVKPRRRVRLASGIRSVSRDLAEYGASIEQSSDLKRVELRMAPQTDWTGYARLFRAWDIVEKQFDLKCDIRFAFHFKRSFDDRHRNKKPHVRLRELLKTLDRESAALQYFLSHPSSRKYRHRISRVDFAGSERECPGDLAAYCVNLLRGSHDDVETLNPDTVDPELHRRWLYLKASGRVRAGHETPVVGVTCHAGEDFAQPLEGIYSVASAVSSFKMRAGDTIGHGLALGAEISGTARPWATDRLTVRGNQFDAVLWLYGRCLHDAPPDVRAQIPALERWLRSETAELYGWDIANLPSLGLFGAGLAEARMGPVAAKLPDLVADTGAWARHQELHDTECAQRRDRKVPIAADILTQEAAIRWIQQKVRDQLARDGIILEFNPSSNLRVSGAESLQKVPFITLLQAAREDILATLNTDNPGVFGTRIENEFALVFSALMESGVSRAHALLILERLRDIGCRFVTWPAIAQPGQA
jgi:Adenosine deaminase